MMSACYPDVRIFKSPFDILKGKQQLQNQKEFEQKKFKFAWFIYTKIKKQKSHDYVLSYIWKSDSVGLFIVKPLRPTFSS